MLVDEIFGGESKTIEYKEILVDHKNLIKTICAFANRNGGKLIIGVNDKGIVTGLSNEQVVEYLEKLPNIISDSISPMVLPEIYTYTVKNLVVIIIEVFPGPSWPYFVKSLGKRDGTYIRVGKTNKQADLTMIQNLERKRINVSYDEDIYCEVDDVHKEEVKKLLKSEFGDLVNDGHLLSLGILRKAGNIEYLTNGGAIILGLLDHSMVRCGRFIGDTSYEFMDRKEYQGNIFEQITNSTNFIVSHLNVAGFFVEGELKRRDKLEIPYTIVREAVINSVLHRDYSIEGSDIKIGIYNSFIEISSPGGLPGTVTIDEIYSGRSEIRNRVLAKVLLKANLIEQWGSGIPRIREACLKNGYKLPILTENGLAVKLTIYRGLDKPIDKVRENKGAYLSYRNKDEDVLSRLIDLIKENQYATVKELSEQVSKPPATVQRKLKKLQEQERIIRVGSKKTGYWKAGS